MLKVAVNFQYCLSDDGSIATESKNRKAENNWSLCLF